MWLLPLTAQIAAATVVDRIVAVVDDRLILASDLHLDSDLSDLDPSTIPMWTRLDPLERQINAALFRAAAGRISLYHPTKATVRARLQQLRAHFQSPSKWSEFLTERGLDERDIISVIEARIMVDLYLRRNIPINPEQHPDDFHRATVALSDAFRAEARIRRIDPR